LLDWLGQQPGEGHEPDRIRCDFLQVQPAAGDQLRTIKSNLNEREAAVQRKLDEILRVLPGADQRLLHLETAPQAELDALDERHGTVRDDALVDPAPAE